MTPPVTQPPLPGAKPVDQPIPDFLDTFQDPISILLIGLTGSGKTTQIGELAKHLYLKSKLKTRLNTTDRGGARSIAPLMRLPFFEVQYLDDTPGADPFVFAEKTARGMIYDKAKKQWVDGRRPDIGMYAFDSAASIAEEMQKAVRDSQATASPIGPKAYAFEIGEGPDKIKVGTTDKSHVGIIQGRVTDAMWESQKLKPRILLWTSALQRTDDYETKTSTLGVEIIGRALATTVPRWFNYTWCLTVESLPNQPNVHVLHTESHVDQGMGMSQVVGNNRIPLDGAAGAPVPGKIKPASVVQALNLLARREKSAEVDIRRMLGLQ